MLLKEYLKKIYVYHIPKKSYKFLDNIVVYTENKRVYKVLLRYRCKVPKLKINSEQKFVEHCPEDVLDDELIQNDKHERLTIIYDRKLDMSNVIVGEDYKTN